MSRRYRKSRREPGLIEIAATSNWKVAAGMSLVYCATSRTVCVHGRQHCSQMLSRAEAEFFLRNCPNTKMDGDNDGIPCENDNRF